MKYHLVALSIFFLLGKPRRKFGISLNQLRPKDLFVSEHYVSCKSNLKIPTLSFLDLRVSYPKRTSKLYVTKVTSKPSSIADKRHKSSCITPQSYLLSEKLLTLNAFYCNSKDSKFGWQHKAEEKDLHLAPQPNFFNELWYSCKI